MRAFLVALLAVFVISGAAAAAPASKDPAEAPKVAQTKKTQTKAGKPGQKAVKVSSSRKADVDSKKMAAKAAAARKEALLKNKAEAKKRAAEKAEKQAREEKLAAKKQAAAEAKEAAFKKAEAKKALAAKKEALARKAEAKKEAASNGKIRRQTDMASVVVNKKRPCSNFVDCLFNSGRSSGPSAYARVNGQTGRKNARVVAWSDEEYPAGTIIVKTPERALYLVLGNGEAKRYSVGVGRSGFQWNGSSTIADKQEWPNWHPPKEMIERELAEHNRVLEPMMPGGPGNPLGARALYIGGTEYRIHGTNNAASIGEAMSSGCIRMMNSDVIDLYNRVNVGAKVYVYQ